MEIVSIAIVYVLVLFYPVFIVVMRQGLTMLADIYVLSDRQLTSMSEWQRAINAECFPLLLDANRPFAKLRGFLPATFDREKAGFECDHWSADILIAELSDVDFGHRWEHALAFRFSGDFRDGVSAFAAAAAYAKATDGVLFDGESGEVMPPSQALREARTMVRDLPANEAWALGLFEKV